MKRSISLILTALLFLSGCSAEPAHGPMPAGSAPVPTYSDSEEAYLSDCIDESLFDGQVLPSATPEGEPIEWTVQSGNAMIEEGVIHKTAAAAEYESISLEADTKSHQVTFRSLTLNDPLVAYVISYFSSDGTDAEQLKLAYTYNGVYWFKVNQDRGILKPSSGTKRLRDPSLVRKPGGGFALLATQGYDTDSIYVYDSEDLVHYENERLLRLNASEEGSMSGLQAWAPEAFYDPSLSTYIIIWSSPKDGGVYYSASDDLTTNTYPALLCDPGFKTIDLTLTHTPSGRAAVLKDEREPMEEYSQLYRAVGPAWYNLTVESSPLYDRHQLEGPMILKSNEKPGWYIYADDYTRSEYRVYYTDDIYSGSLREAEDNDVLIPLEKPSHSYALPVTWKELERILAVYPDGQ